MGGAVYGAYLVPIRIMLADQFNGNAFIETQFIVVLGIVVVQCL